METKSGTKTTEFWASIAPIVTGVFEGKNGNPEVSKYLIVCGCVLTCFYIVSRTVIKLYGAKEKSNGRPKTED
jgi:hypothetical protein